jgi:hypothetical protein
MLFINYTFEFCMPTRQCCDTYLKKNINHLLFYLDRNINLIYLSISDEHFGFIIFIYLDIFFYIRII